MTIRACYLCSVGAFNRVVQLRSSNPPDSCKMKPLPRKMILGLVLTVALMAPAAGKKMTKTKYDYRMVRSPTHHMETSAAYVLSSQANPEEKAHANFQQVSLLSESQYEALLKQAQKALQGYDLSKLAASVETAHKAVPVAAPTPVVEPKPVQYKPQYKYVYAEAPTSVTYNSASAYDAYSSHDQHDDHEPYYSKHKFGYRVHDPHSGAAFGHSEVSEGHVTRGHYHVLLPDGRLQNVKYVADPSGYHATVTYESYKN